MDRKQFQINKQFQLRKKELLQIMLICLGIYVAVLGITIGVNLHLTDKVLAPFATIFTLLAFCILQFCNDLVRFVTDFNVAVSMGQTRKSFVWSYELISLIYVILMILGIFLLNKAEGAIGYAIFGSAASGMDVTDSISELELVSAAVIFVAFDMLLQTLILHFGTKALWIFWAVMMILLYLPGMISRNQVISEKCQLLVEGIHKMIRVNSGFWSWFFGAGIVYAVILVLISWFVLRKQRVTM